MAGLHVARLKLPCVIPALGPRKRLRTLRIQPLTHKAWSRRPGLKNQIERGSAVWTSGRGDEGQTSKLVGEADGASRGVLRSKSFAMELTSSIEVWGYDSRHLQVLLQQGRGYDICVSNTSLDNWATPTLGNTELSSASDLESSPRLVHCISVDGRRRGPATRDRGNVVALREFPGRASRAESILRLHL